MKTSLVLTVALSLRQQRQLLAVSDELGVPIHEVGEQAVAAFLETYGHRRKGRLRKAARKPTRKAREDIQ